MCEKYSQRAMIGNKYCKHLFFGANVKTSNVRMLNIFYGLMQHENSV